MVVYSIAKSRCQCSPTGARKCARRSRSEPECRSGIHPPRQCRGTIAEVTGVSTSRALTARLPSTSSVSFRNTRPPWFRSTEGGVCMPARTISNSARQTPFLSVADCARPATPDRSGVRMDCNRGNLRAVVGSLSEPTAAAGRGPPVEVVAAACAPSRPRSRAFGPFTVVRRAGARPPAGRSASESAAQRLSEGLPNPRGYLRVPPEIR